MKKIEIMNLLNCSEGVYRLNNISYLSRWTKDATGNAIDGLAINFVNINGVNYGYSMVDITARDYEGIIDECVNATNKYLDEIKQQLTNNLTHGYRACGSNKIDDYNTQNRKNDFVR